MEAEDGQRDSGHCISSHVRILSLGVCIPAPSAGRATQGLRRKWGLAGSGRPASSLVAMAKPKLCAQLRLGLSYQTQLKTWLVVPYREGQGLPGEMVPGWMVASVDGARVDGCQGGWLSMRGKGLQLC